MSIIQVFSPAMPSHDTLVHKVFMKNVGVCVRALSRACECFMREYDLSYALEPTGILLYYFLGNCLSWL